MNSAGHCPQCERELSRTAPLGLCSQCLLQSILEPATPEDETADDPLSARRGAFGDYEILEVIACGGMGVVYRARQISLHRIVALKMIRAGNFASEAEQKRFRAEAEAAAHLDHSNIVPIFEIGECDGQDYFAMKLIEGASLQEVIGGQYLASKHASGEREAPLKKEHWSLTTLAALVAKVAHAVHYAHQRGVLHRDLKPANILLDAGSEPFITDFGLAKRIETGLDLTLSGAVIGTPNYMSPEQAAGRSREITTAADVYSLGAILYELIAGRPPFQADTPLATMRKVVEEEPVPPSRVRREVISNQYSVISGATDARRRETEHWLPKTDHSAFADRDLETICLKCLQKNPGQRYASAAALADDLERWSRHEPIHARPSTAWEHGVKWARRKPALAALISLALLAPALIIAVLLISGARVRRERNFSWEQARLATNALTRAEAGERAARESAYAADIYAAFQALSADNLAVARRLLNEHRPGGIPNEIGRAHV